MEDRELFDTSRCTIAGTLEIVGEKWSLLIIREAFYGVSRFEDFHRYVGCARNLLASRLEKLVEHGVLRRDPYQKAGHRTRNEYLLTDKGRELYPVLTALRQWGDKHEAGQAGPSAHVYHAGCGGTVYAVLTCEHGHADLDSDDVEMRPLCPVGTA